MEPLHRCGRSPCRGHRAGAHTGPPTKRREAQACNSHPSSHQEAEGSPVCTTAGLGILPSSPRLGQAQLLTCGGGGTSVRSTRSSQGQVASATHTADREKAAALQPSTRWPPNKSCFTRQCPSQAATSSRPAAAGFSKDTGDTPDQERHRAVRPPFSERAPVTSKRPVKPPAWPETRKVGFTRAATPPRHPGHAQSAAGARQHAGS